MHQSSSPLPRSPCFHLDVRRDERPRLARVMLCGMRRVFGFVRGTTRKVHQLTGEQDRERGVPTLNRTESTVGMFGTDLGASFEHDGRLWFLFGDTVSSVGYSDLRP